MLKDSDHGTSVQLPSRVAQPSSSDSRRGSLHSLTQLTTSTLSVQYYVNDLLRPPFLTLRQAPAPIPHSSQQTSTMAIAPIVGRLRKGLIMDLSVALGAGSGTYYSASVCNTGRAIADNFMLQEWATLSGTVSSSHFPRRHSRT